MLVPGSYNRPLSPLQLEKQKLKDEVKRRLRAEKTLRELLMAQPVRDREEVLEIVEHLRLGEYELDGRQQQEQEDDDGGAGLEITPVNKVNSTGGSPNFQRSVLFDHNSKPSSVTPNRLNFPHAPKKDEDSQDSSSFSLFPPQENGFSPHGTDQGQMFLAQEGDLIRKLKEELHVTNETVILQKSIQSDLEADLQQQRKRLKQVEAENQELLSQSKIQQGKINLTSNQLEFIQQHFMEEKQKTEQLRANLLQEQYNVEHWQEEFEKLRKEFEQLKSDFEKYKSDHLNEREAFQKSYNELENSLEMQMYSNQIQQEAIEKLTEERDQVFQQSDLWHSKFYESEGTNDVLKVQVDKSEKLRGEAEEAVKKLGEQLNQQQIQIKNIVLQNEQQNQNKIDKDAAAGKLMEVWSKVFSGDLEKFSMQSVLEKQQEQIDQLERQVMFFGKESETRQKSEDKLSDFKLQLQNLNSNQYNPQISVENNNLADKIKQIISQMQDINSKCLAKVGELKKFLDEDNEKDESKFKDVLQNTDSAISLLSQQYQQLSEQVKMLLEDSETKMEDYIHLFESKVQLLQLLEDFEQLKNENQSKILVSEQKYEDFEKQFDNYLEWIKEGKIEVPIEQSGPLSDKSVSLVDQQYDKQRLEYLQKKLAAGIVQVQQKFSKLQKLKEDDDPESEQGMKDIIVDLSVLNQQIQALNQQLLKASNGQALNQDYDGMERRVSVELSEVQGKIHLDLSQPPTAGLDNNLQIISPRNITLLLQQAQQELNLLKRDAQYLSSNLVGEYDAEQLDISHFENDLIKNIAEIIQKLISHNKKLENNNQELQEVKQIIVNSEFGDSLDSEQREKAKSGVDKLVQVLCEQKSNLKDLVLLVQYRNENISELYMQLKVLESLNEQLKEQLQESNTQLFEVQQLYQMKSNDCDQLQKINKKLESTCKEWTDQGRSLMDQLRVVTDAHANLHTQLMLQGHQNTEEGEEEPQQQQQAPETPTHSTTTAPQIDAFQTPNLIPNSPSSQLNDSAYQTSFMEHLRTRNLSQSPPPTLELPHAIEDTGEDDEFAGGRGLRDIDFSGAPDHLTSFLDEIKQSLLEFDKSESVVSNRTQRSDVAFAQSFQSHEDTPQISQDVSFQNQSQENTVQTLGRQDSEVLQRNVVGEDQKEKEEEGQVSSSLEKSQLQKSDNIVDKKQVKVDSNETKILSEVEKQDLTSQNQIKVESVERIGTEGQFGEQEQEQKLQNVGDKSQIGEEVKGAVEIGDKVVGEDQPPKKIIHLDGKRDVGDAQNVTEGTAQPKLVGVEVGTSDQLGSQEIKDDGQ